MEGLERYASKHWERMAGGRGTAPFRETGRVVAVRGDLAEVRFPRGRLCEGCGACCVADGEGAMVAEARNPLGAVVGQLVVVELPVRQSLKAAYILYGVPLLAFLTGLVIGSVLGHLFSGGSLAVPLGLVLAFAFLALSYLLLGRIYSPRSRASERYRPVITAVLGRAGSEEYRPGSG